MTLSRYKIAALSATAFAALALAGPAVAATDYLLQIGSIPGESKIVTGAGPGAGPHVKKEKWIELESVQLGTARMAGGVNVAAGDVNGDGVKAPHDVATGQSSGKRTHKPVRVIKSADEQTAALLLPAVQKVREAAARMPAWKGCAAGQTIEGMAIQQVSTGRSGQILDPVVVSCATDSVSFNFTKIKWE